MIFILYQRGKNEKLNLEFAARTLQGGDNMTISNISGVIMIISTWVFAVSFIAWGFASILGI